jgi:hypothetical protein
VILLRKLFSRLLRTNIVSYSINFDDGERIEGFYSRKGKILSFGSSNGQYDIVSIRNQ